MKELKEVCSMIKNKSMIFEKISTIFSSLLLSPVIMDITTGTDKIVTLSDNQMVLSLANLAITALTTIAVTLGVTYIKAKFKVKE